VTWTPLEVFVVVGLATWYAVEAVKHKAIFAWFRSRAELWTGWWGELYACPFCLSFWVGSVLLAPFIFGLPEGDGWQDEVGRGLLRGWRWTILAFAVARVASLGYAWDHAEGLNPDLGPPPCDGPEVATVEDGTRDPSPG